jgi:CRP-like cAMP-binding protein
VNTPVYNIFTGLLRAALLAALIGAGWNIYRNLPGGELGMGGATAGAQSATALQIVLRRAPNDADAPMDIPVELYSIDVAALRREYGSEPRPGMRFEDFLARRMKSHPPVTSRLDRGGQTTVMIAPGKWWIRALLSGEQNVEWRLPVEVAGRRQTVELTPENAYARMKSF